MTILPPFEHHPVARSGMPTRTALPDGPIPQRQDSTAISPTSSQSYSSVHSASSPPPPPTPQAWIWRCHICNATFRLSCTRRCLHCGHVMCTTPPPPPPPPATSSSSSSSSRRKSRAGPCAMEFDYERWAAWGDWRRLCRTAEGGDTLQQQTNRSWSEREAQRKRRLYDRQGSCLDDCDYPSDCHHLRSEMRQPFTMVDGGEVSPLSPLALASVTSSMEEAARSILRMGVVEEADCVFAAADYLESRFAGARRGENSGLGFDVYVDAPEREDWDEWWDDDSGYGAASEDEDVDMVYEDIRG